MFVDGQSAISCILGSDKQTKCTENPRKKDLRGVKVRRPYLPLAIIPACPYSLALSEGYLGHNLDEHHLEDTGVVWSRCLTYPNGGPFLGRGFLGHK